MTTAQSDLADRLAVQDVMIRYATSCDARDMEAYGSCFTEDALISGFGGEDIHGRQAWVDYVAKALTRFTGTQHMLGNQVVQLNGDEATLQTSVQATHFLADRPGTTLTLTAPYAVTSGDGLLVGSIFGVAAGDAASGASVEAALTGIFDLTKIGSQAWTIGAKVYWDDTNKRCTTVATDNTLIGVAVTAVAGGAGDTIGRVRLNGSF